MRLKWRIYVGVIYMKMRYFGLFFILFLSCIVQLVAMDGNGTSVIFDGRERAVRQTIQAVQNGGAIRLETPFFSSTEVQKDLMNAKERGVDVFLHLASGSKVDQEKLKKAGIKVKIVPGLHAKRVLCEDADQDKENREPNTFTKKRKRSVVYFGSDNLTKVSPFQREMWLVSKNSPEYFQQHVNAFDEEQKSAKKGSEKKVVEVTPLKPKVYGSGAFDLNLSKGKRLEKLFTEADNQNSVDINSMTFDSDEFVSSIEKVFEKCGKDKQPAMRFFLDKSALKHKDLLNRVKKVGGDKAKVYIFNEDKKQLVFGKFPQLQHRKSIVRDTKKGPLAIVSTGNLANRSNVEINYDSYHPGDQGLYDAIRAANDKLLLECEEYQLPPETQS